MRQSPVGIALRNRIADLRSLAYDRWPGEQVIARLQPRPPNSGFYGFPSGRRDLKLQRPLRFARQHARARCDPGVEPVSLPDTEANSQLRATATHLRLGLAGPRALSQYMATSDCRSKSSYAFPSTGYRAMPMLVATPISVPPIK
jgi:hypothetical protein